MAAAVSVRATGVRFDEADPGPDQWSRMTPERRADRAAWARGELLFVSVTAFVEFDDDSGAQRWTGSPQGPFAVPLSADATSLLMDLANVPDDLLADLGIAGYKVTRFDFLAASRRVELADSLRERLTLR